MEGKEVVDTKKKKKKRVSLEVQKDDGRSLSLLSYVKSNEVDGRTRKK